MTVENRAMRRRVLASVMVALNGLAASFSSLAQTPPKVWRIGVLYPDPNNQVIA